MSIKKFLACGLSLISFSGFATAKLFSKKIKMPRVLWVVRHAEREDNINSNWRKTANPHKLKSDNSPLSSRGHQQAKELAARLEEIFLTVKAQSREICLNDILIKKNFLENFHQFRFANVHIDHIFASPFERTVETATAIASEIKIPIKLEPGLCEVIFTQKNFFSKKFSRLYICVKNLLVLKSQKR